MVAPVGGVMASARFGVVDPDPPQRERCSWTAAPPSRAVIKTVGRIVVPRVATVVEEPAVGVEAGSPWGRAGTLQAIARRKHLLRRWRQVFRRQRCDRIGLVGRSDRWQPAERGGNQGQPKDTTRSETAMHHLRTPFRRVGSVMRDEASSGRSPLPILPPARAVRSKLRDPLFWWVPCIIHSFGHSRSAAHRFKRDPCGAAAGDGTVRITGKSCRDESDLPLLLLSRLHSDTAFRVGSGQPTARSSLASVPASEASIRAICTW